MDFLESRKPSAEEVMPFIRQAQKTESQAVEKSQTEAILKTLNRALARGAVEKPTDVVR
jgi:hypothetical protein